MKKFMRTRPPPTPAHPAQNSNGLSKGGGVRHERDGHHSTMSRYWSGSDEDRVPPGPLWEDPDFGLQLPERRRATHNVVWLRPHELCLRPRFLGDTSVDAPHQEETEQAVQIETEPPDQFAARWCVEVGEVGCSALCSAAAALALTPRLLARVAPPQSFRNGYTGRFRFQFWVFGSWREVCIDDRLPARATRTPHNARLLVSRSGLADDFTLPLLEKAYAKLHGSYGALAGASASVARALQELTGGVVQSFSPPRQPPRLLLQVLHSALPRSTIIIATTTEKESVGRRLRNGLIAGQAYCVTGLARVREESNTEAGGALVRLRAPSGRGEWAGAWARGSAQWRALAAADRDLLESRATQPGHFWMSFADFARAFGRLELVHVGPDDWLREPSLQSKRAWRAVVARRRWRPGYNAGGPPSAPTAHANPQFQLQVPRGEPDECHVVVSVMQQYTVGARPTRLHAIGFALYELPPSAPPARPHLAHGFAELRPLDVTHECAAREVATFFTVPSGRYLLVPHTRLPHTSAAFLLRILTDRHTDVWEVNEDNAIIRDIAAEFEQEGWPVPKDMQSIVNKLLRKQETEEVEGEAVAEGLRCWRGRPSVELCRALIALRDPGLTGRVSINQLPPLLALLACWRAAVAGTRCGRRVSTYRLRALLWGCGLTASNKVLECLVLRYARGTTLAPEDCLLALARLHLAHERYRCLDAKLKTNPLSLEEMILMTIYS
ncbi:unnamed protein product [Leptosia nina]|uniref:Calpain catalytic domain-containing protein n=1 Tax=Leptosia nina TaxID=320188 RepID=A0AAV1JMZ9_9NEOP